MVAGGDDQFSVVHLLLDGGDYGRIGDLPNTMHDVIFVGDFNVWSGRGFESGVDFPSAVVKHEDLTKMGARCAQQIEAVGLRLRQGLFVAENHAGGIVLDAAEGDESLPLNPR